MYLLFSWKTKLLELINSDSHNVIILSGGTGYKKLPVLSGSSSTIASDATVDLLSDSIGNIQKIRVLNDTYYSKNMGKGAKVAGSNIPDKDFTKYPETSLFGSVLKEACNLLD